MNVVLAYTSYNARTMYAVSFFCLFFNLEAPTGIEPVYAVLQTAA